MLLRLKAVERHNNIAQVIVLCLWFYFSQSYNGRCTIRSNKDCWWWLYSTRFLDCPKWFSCTWNTAFHGICKYSNIQWSLKSKTVIMKSYHICTCDIQATIQVHCAGLSLDPDGFLHSSFPVTCFWNLDAGFLPVDDMALVLHMNCDSILFITSLDRLFVFWDPFLQGSARFTNVYFFTFTTLDLIHHAFLLFRRDSVLYLDQ